MQLTIRELKYSGGQGGKGEGEGKIRVAAECMREKVIKELVERSSSSTGNWPTMGFSSTVVE